MRLRFIFMFTAKVEPDKNMNPARSANLAAAPSGEIGVSGRDAGSPLLRLFFDEQGRSPPVGGEPCETLSALGTSGYWLSGVLAWDFGKLGLFSGELYFLPRQLFKPSSPPEGRRGTFDNP